MAWLQTNSLYLLLTVGTIFNVFWLYRMRRQLQMKWYAVLILSVLHTAIGVCSVKVFAFLESGDIGNMSLFGGVFFMPAAYWLGAKLTKRPCCKVCDVFTPCMLFTLMCARVNCIVAHYIWHPTERSASLMNSSGRPLRGCYSTFLMSGQPSHLRRDSAFT